MTFNGGGRSCMYVLEPFSFYASLTIRSSGFKFALLALSEFLQFFPPLSISHTALELQLAALVDRFEFAPPDEEIVWNMNHIQAPTVHGRESQGAQMPLKVSIAA